MKKFLIAIIGLFMSIFAFSQPAYAYFEMIDSNDYEDRVISYDSTYQISGQDVHVYEIEMTDYITGDYVIFYFNETIANTYITAEYWKISLVNSAPMPSSYASFQSIVYDSVGGNLDVSYHLLRGINLNDNILYLHIATSFDASYLLAKLQTGLQLYYGGYQHFFNRVRLYEEGYAEGDIAGQITGYADGYDDGENDLYTNGSVAQGLAPSGSYDVSYGYGLGQTDMYDNGSSLYGFIQANSQDYTDGYDEGQEAGLSTHYASFMSGFEKWIVPAILIILILGGTLAMRRRKEGE